MAKSSIEWTDETWNPVTGCTRASTGCDNCYAVKMTKRLEAMGQEKYKGLVNIGKDHFNGVVKCHEDALELPFRWTKPRKVFVNSMSDLFHKDVPFEFIDKVFATMALCPQHTFQILTKRPERMAEYLARDRREQIDEIRQNIALGKWGPVLSSRFEIWKTKFVESNPMAWPLKNVWLGTSVEDQKTADERIPHLLKVPAAVRFLSCEPLLGPVDLVEVGADQFGHGAVFALTGQAWIFCGPDEGGQAMFELGDDPGPEIHWVIAGGESGPNARPMHPDWARSLRDQCQASGVPFFFKQWGEWVTEDQSPEDIILPSMSFTPWAVPKNKYDYAFQGGDQTSVWRPGKKAAGRLLDGRTHDEYPEVSKALASETDGGLN